jgi:hypothetical protein
MDAVQSLGLTCHRRLDRFPVVVGVVPSCSTPGAAGDGVEVDGVLSLSVCDAHGTGNPLSLLYISDDVASGCQDHVDRFSYLAVALPDSSSVSTLGWGIGLAQYAHSALTAWCGTLPAECARFPAARLGKYYLSTAVTSTSHEVVVSLAPSNALPIVGSSSSPMIRVTGAGYVVTDIDAEEVDTAGRLWVTSVAVGLSARGVDLPSEAQRDVEAPPTGSCLRFVLNSELLACFS